jgi:hypothetical protein
VLYSETPVDNHQFGVSYSGWSSGKTGMVSFVADVACFGDGVCTPAPFNYVVGTLSRFVAPVKVASVGT